MTLSAKDQAAGAGAVEGPGEVGRGVDLVGVDEDEVEGAAAFRGEEGEGLERGADAQVDQIGDPGAFDVGPGDLGVGGVELERGQQPFLGEAAGHGDRRVAGEGAELEDSLGADRPDQDLQQARLRRGDLHLGEARRVGVGLGGFERRVRQGEESRFDEGVDRVEGILVWAPQHAHILPEGPAGAKLRPGSVPCYLSWSAQWAMFHPAVRLMGRGGILYSRGNRSDEGSSVR